MKVSTPEVLRIIPLHVKYVHVRSKVNKELQYFFVHIIIIHMLL